MSLNHIINQDADVKYDIFCKSLSANELTGGNTLVDDLSFKTQNADIVNLSSLSTYGNGGERLTSNGDGSVSWVVGSGSSGVDYNGVLPVAINKLAIYGATDGLLIKDSSLDETDLLNTQSKANNNEFSISTLSLTKLNKSGDTMSGDLNMNSNDIKSAENVYTNNLYSKAGLGLIKVNNGGIDFQSTNNIHNVNNVQTQEIKSTDGVSINIQDDINMGSYDINNCNDIKVNALSTNTSPNIVSNNNLDMNNNDLLNVGNMNVSTINNITAVGGLYAGISNGVIINQASGQTDLLPTSSVGSLSIPANAFQVGDAYHLVVAGIFPSESNSDDITIDVKQNGTTIASINLDLENFDTSPSNFELEMDFVIRSIGITGSIASNLDFSFNKKVTKDFRGTRSTDITTINTTTASSLSVLASVNGAGSSIQSRLAYLRKQY
jgi:hypothetical protein